MKKFLIVAALIVLGAGVGNAQSRFGIKAGLNFNSLSDIKVDDIKASMKSKTGFHAGVVYQVKLPLKFALQPELLYISKNSEIGNADLKMHYFQLPVNIQWGVDLVLLRPYLQVSPYIGYAFSNASDKILKSDSDLEFDKFAYGIGLGAGIEIWKFQVSGRYCWDLGNVATFKEQGIKRTNAKNKGFELSLAYLF